MSATLVERILKTPMKSMSDKALLGLMGTFANADGTRCFPGVRRLAKESGLHERNVQLGLRRLERGGWIKPTARARQHKTTEYEIAVGRLVVLARDGVTTTSGRVAGVTIPIPRGGVSCAPGVAVAPPDSKTLTLGADSRTESKTHIPPTPLCVKALISS